MASALRSFRNGAVCLIDWLGIPLDKQARLVPELNLMKTRASFIFIVVSLICVGLLPKVEAVSPPPDGGYPNGNTAEGENALFSLSTGFYNTAIGYFALKNNTTGQFNTAIGAGTLLFNTADQNTATGAAALLSNSTGEKNTAVGEAALFSNTTGNNNTGIGESALLNNTTGNSNTALGANALFLNTTGTNNIGIGVSALLNNTTGSTNTALGRSALVANTTGPDNTAIGGNALNSNTTGSSNTALGRSALFLNTTGPANTAIGGSALNSNTTGSSNTALGADALFNNTTGATNTAIGTAALRSNTTGLNNTALGGGAGINLTTGIQNTDIDNPGVAGESFTIRIGDSRFQARTFIAAIAGTAVAGTAVVVNENGQLGVAPSSERFKYEIKPMDKASEALFALKPVTFHYKKKIDSAGVSQFGLVAEDVKKVNPALVLPDKEGKPYTVRYDAVNAMLLNEFLKEHRTVQEQGTIISEQQKEIDALKVELKEQRVLIQKVSAQLEVSKAAPQTVLNNH